MQSIVVSWSKSSPDILEAIFSLSLFLRPPGPSLFLFLFFTSFWASEIAFAVAAADRIGLLPVPVPVSADAGGVGAADVDDEVVAVVVGGADGGGVEEFESVIGTSFELSSNELCLPNLSNGFETAADVKWFQIINSIKIVGKFKKIKKIGISIFFIAFLAIAKDIGNCIQSLI